VMRRLERAVRDCDGHVQTRIYPNLDHIMLIGSLAMPVRWSAQTPPPFTANSASTPDIWGGCFVRISAARPGGWRRAAAGRSPSG